MAKKKLDIKEVMANINANNKDWLSTLPDEDVEGFEPFIVMQFLSTSSNPNAHVDNLEITNDVLNKDFTSLYDNKDLFFRLACVCRSNDRAFRPFIKPPKSKKTVSLIEKLVMEYSNERMTQYECETFIKKNKIYGIDFWVDMAESYDWSDADVKKLVKELKQVI